MAAARSLARKLLRLEGNTSTHGLSAMGVAAGFVGASAAASAASDEGAACPAYPWPHDGAQGGRKVFMQSDCAACHSMLPYAGLSLREAAHGGEVEAKVAEIVVEEQPATLRPLQSGAGAYTPIVPKMLQGLRHSNLYELKEKIALPTPVWLQFLQPYTSGGLNV